MTVGEILEVTKGQVLCGEESLDREIGHAFAADLMSDVLTLESGDVLFITGLVTPQTVRTAIIADIRTILIARGKQVPRGIIDLARENGIQLLRTPYSMFRASGVLFQAGLEPIY